MEIEFEYELSFQIQKLFILIWIDGFAVRGI